jgi:hypothetical protein
MGKKIHIRDERTSPTIFLRAEKQFFGLKYYADPNLFDPGSGIRIRILQKVSDPTASGSDSGSGSTTLLFSVKICILIQILLRNVDAPTLNMWLKVSLTDFRLF